MMHIAHYYPWLYLTSGVERTILEICRRSRHQHTVFTNCWDRGNTYPEFANVTIRELSTVSVKRSLIPVMKASLRIAFGKLDLAGCDCMMIHCDGLGDLALVRNRQLPTVCFCHTPLRPAFDEAYRKRVAPKYRGVLRPAFEASRIAFKLVDQRLWQRYSHVLFNSNETRRRAENGGLLRNLGGNHAILHPGIDWDAFQPSWDYKKYFFVPGRIMWTKNIELAIEAYRGFVKRCPNSGFRLVIAGRVDAKSRPYAQALRGRCAELPDVQFIENPSDDALFRLYRDCYSVLFPPFNEDWGMVPLEANAFGKPVIAVDAGGPRESQVPGRTGLLVPAEASAFCQAMVLLAENEELVRRMGRTGRVHARTYDWSHFVGAIDTLCEQLLGTGLSPVPTLAAEETREGTEAWT